MANSQYGYVRDWETWDPIPRSNWIVVRIDGRGFSKLCKKYEFEKPNDKRALDLMNAAAVKVTHSLVDIIIAYGQSDEYSFVFSQDTTLFDRRAMKLVTTVVSTFTAAYCMLWPTYFSDVDLTEPWPSFDGRCVAYPYPNVKLLRDYLSWRQADCHINNLYNTTFWNMVLKGEMTGTEAEEKLKGTVAADKNEILFGQFGVNYNFEPAIFRKGTVVYRAYDLEEDGVTKAANWLEGLEVEQSRTQVEKEKKRKRKAKVVVEHVDLIGDGFWEERPYILGGKAS